MNIRISYGLNMYIVHFETYFFIYKYFTLTIEIQLKLQHI